MGWVLGNLFGGDKECLMVCGLLGGDGDDDWEFGGVLTFWLVVAYCLCFTSNVLLALVMMEGGGRRFRLGHNTTKIVGERP
jgi:hypothetical protein